MNVTPKGTVSFLPWREKDIILKGEEWLEDTVWVLVEREEEDGKAARAGGGGVEVCAMEGREASGVGLFVSLIFFRLSHQRTGGGVPSSQIGGLEPVGGLEDREMRLLV